MKIGRKLSIWIFFIILVISVFSMYFYQRMETADEIEKLKLMSVAAGSMMEQGLYNYFMLTEDHSTLTEPLHRFKAVTPISNFWIISREGMVKAAMNKEVVGSRLHPTDSGCVECHGVPREQREKGIILEGKNTYRVAQPLRNLPQCHKCHDPSVRNNGYLIIDFSFKESQKHIEKNVDKGFVVMLLSFLFIGSAILGLTNFMVSKRLGRVVDKARKIEEGDYEGKMALPGEGRDEITELEASFNQMAKAIQKREEIMRSIAEEVSSKTGEEFFRSMVQFLAKVLEVDYAFAGELMNIPEEKVRTIALCIEGELAENIEYSLAHTPSQDLVMKDFCYCPQGVQQLFPLDHLLAEMGVESCIGTPLFDSAGQPLGLLVAMDRKPMRNHETAKSLFQILAVRASAELERKRADEELKKLVGKLEEALAGVSRSQKEWQNTFNSITDLVSIHDADFNIVKANAAFLKHFGLSSLEEVLNKKCYQLFHRTSEPLRECPHKVTLRERRPVTEEVKDPATQNIFRIATFPYYSPQDEILGSIHIARDITELKEKEMRLIMSERLASLGQMASSVAHEINNPLASIAGCAEGLYNRVETDRYEPELFKSYLGIVKDEIIRCKKITSDMLSFVRKTVYEKKKINVNETIDACLEVISFQNRLKQVAIVKNYQADLPAVFGGPEELRQVFLTIITNALDAMDDKGTLTLQTGLGDDKVFIKISDTGCGIPHEIVNQIFNPFFTTKSGRGGTGLGLAIAHKIISNHRGQIYVTSEEGKGTTFETILPV